MGKNRREPLHTVTYPGRTVRLVLADGREVVGRFQHKTRKGHIHLDVGRFHQSQVRFFQTLRGGKTRPGA